MLADGTGQVLWQLEEPLGRVLAGGSVGGSRAREDRASLFASPAVDVDIDAQEVIDAHIELGWENECVDPLVKIG